MSGQSFDELGGVLAAPPRRRRRQLAAAAVALAVAAAAIWAVTGALITGCPSGGTAAPAAIKQVADQAQQMTSLAGAVSQTTQCGLMYDPENGSWFRGCSDYTDLGTFQIQLRPGPLVDSSLNYAYDFPPDEAILTGSEVYENDNYASTSKPWLAAALSSTGSTVSQMVQDAEEFDPLTWLQEITASKNPRATGTEVTHGVNTACYAGTLTPSTAAAPLSPSLRAFLSPALKAIRGDISWSIWTDSQYNLRKLTVSYTEHNGTPTSLTMTVTSTNKPVRVALPPPGQVSVVSGK